MVVKYIRSFKPLARYNRLVIQYPTLIMATTSSISMGLGNYICQAIAEKKDFSTIEWDRIIKFACYGFFISGPMFRYWLYALDLKIFKDRTSKLRPFKMMLLDQLIMPLLANSLFLMYLNLFTTKSLSDSWDKTKVQLVPILTASYKVWPIITLVNFYIIPLQHRVLFGNTVSLLWNVYFSYLVIKSKEETQQVRE